MKFIATILVVIGLTVPAAAQSDPQMWRWFKLGAGFIGEPAQSSLDIYRSQGLILSRLGTDYFSYSFSESRLTETERKDAEGSQASKNFVLGFHACNPSGDFAMSGTIFRVSLFSKSDDLDEFLREFVSIMSEIRNLDGVLQNASETGVTFFAETALGDISFLVSTSEQDIRLEITDPTVCQPT